MTAGMDPMAQMRGARVQAALSGGGMRPDTDTAALPMGQMARAGGPDMGGMPSQAQFGLSRARMAMAGQPPPAAQPMGQTQIGNYLTPTYQQQQPMPGAPKDAGSFFDVFGKP